VVARGGVGGAGEILRALSPDHFTVDPGGVRCSLTAIDVEALPPISETEWPDVAPEPIEKQPSRRVLAEGALA